MEQSTLSGFGDEIADSLQSQLDVLAKFGILHIELSSVNGKPFYSIPRKKLSN